MPPQVIPTDEVQPHPRIFLRAVPDFAFWHIISGSHKKGLLLPSGMAPTKIPIHFFDA
jgi:hypothetical protein